MSVREKLVDKESPLPILGQPSRLLAKLLRFMKLGTGTHILAVLDQLLVSGTSFLMTVAVGRWTSARELGIYAIAMSVVAAATAFQDALIIKPFTIQRFSTESPKAEHAGSSLILSLALGLLLSFVIGVGGLIFNFGHELNGPMIVVAVACMIPFVLIREFARKIAIANLQMASALVLDFTSACTSLLILLMLAATDKISPTTVCFGIAAVSSIVTLSWFRRARSGLNYSRKSLVATASQDWRLGKWLFVGKLTREIQQSAPYWIVLFISGAAATGLYAASMSIIAFANPVIFGIANVLTPKSVIAWNETGGEGLRRQCYRDTLFLGALMAVFCVGIAIFGTSMIRLLFHGSDFAGSTQMLVILALGITASTLGLPASVALATIERPRAIVVTGGFAAVLSVILVIAFMFLWGTIGAAYGFFIGNSLGALGRWAAFLKIVPRASNTQEVLNILQASGHLDGQTKANVRRVGEGDDAVVYAVDGGARGVLQDGKPSLIVKLFKSEAGIDEKGMQAQFHALGRLHNAIGQITRAGWTAEAPAPLYASSKPLAIVMTLAPGRNILMAASPLESLPAAQWPQIADVCWSGLSKLWSHDQIHGDLGLQNVLVDFTQSRLSLIDPGTVESCKVCSLRGSGSPVAFDLGHLLADYAMDAADISGNIASGNRRQILTETLIELSLLNAKPEAAQRELLSAIRDCCENHVTDKLNNVGALRGLWLRWIKKNGERRVSQLLIKLADTHLPHGPAGSLAAAE